VNLDVDGYGETLNNPKNTWKQENQKNAKTEISVKCETGFSHLACQGEILFSSR